MMNDHSEENGRPPRSRSESDPPDVSIEMLDPPSQNSRDLPRMNGSGSL